MVDFEIIGDENDFSRLIGGWMAIYWTQQQTRRAEKE